MRFTLGRVVHFYYVFVLMAMTGLFVYGAKFYWSSGLLNIEYVSNLYDGTSKVRAVKERNDLDEIKKFVDGDRIKDANRIFKRLEQDIQDLKSIKPTGSLTTFESNTSKIKVELNNFQSAPELTTILNSISSKVTTFENFVTEKKWPTLTKMAMNLRIKTSPGRLMQGGLYNFEKTQNLTQSINNDIEAMTNFTESSGLQTDIKMAIINRIKTIKLEAGLLENYVEDHKKFNRVYKDFGNDYQEWFKFVEPEIALKKIQFEKSSQTILYSFIIIFASFSASIILGFVIYNYSAKRGSLKTEKLILDTIKEGLLPVDPKNMDQFSHEFTAELEKYRDYVHKRITYGSVFQEAMPFASILLDSNLNLIWGNSHFYEEWKLQNFNEDGGDSLTWDFLQRFTNLEDNSSILSALRMSTSGVYKIQVKTAGIAKAIPYEMHVSPAEYSGQKRIMIIFYPMTQVEERLNNQKSAITAPMIEVVHAYYNESMTNDLKTHLREKIEEAGGGELYTKFSQYVEKHEAIQDDLTGEIERLENALSEQRNTVTEIRKSLVSSFETQRASMNKFNQFKATVSGVLDARDQLEEQFRFTLNCSKDFYKDQNKILSSAEKADKTVDEYLRSLKTITGLKSEFKELKGNVDEFKSRITQVLDQLLIFQNQEGDTQRIDQFLGKIKLEMRGFEKVLNGFNQVVTMLDVTVTKLDMMVESREKIDLDLIKSRLESIRNNLDNAQFSAAKISQNAHSKDDELVNVLKSLVANLKSEMKRVDEMCVLSGLTPEHLQVISPSQEVSV
ncbi:MAG: hypothetical protein KBD76_00540 [Bacteriovorax sp.]|nr:hypothetical protein [Bacteriovorax sp.]